jgi:hypothetical protein
MTQLEFTIKIIDVFEKEWLQEQNDISIGPSSIGGTGDGESTCKKDCCYVLCNKNNKGHHGECFPAHKYNK